MDQKKIGLFIKELRKEKCITQEELAEAMSTSRRTISRWETGSNMPDLDMIPELADFFNIEIKEFFEGQKMSESKEEIKETVLLAADYSNNQKKKSTIFIIILFIIGLLSLITNQILLMSDLPETFIVGFFEGITLGLTFWALVMGILYCTGTFAKLMAIKKRIIGKKEAN